jgi:hypothetical protein
MRFLRVRLTAKTGAILARLIHAGQAGDTGRTVVSRSRRLSIAFRDAKIAECCKALPL